MTMGFRKFLLASIFCFHLISVKGQEERKFVQRILLDKMIDAGDLKLFPSFGEGHENEYYYLPNKLRLATNEEGIPIFSFIRFVDNQLTVSDNSKSEVQAGGGGILHMLVGLHISESEKAKALGFAKAKNPDAKIVGPVIYRSGTISIVSILPEEQNKVAVLGIGNAPIIEGDNVAVSILLDKKSAKILWESFKMPVPPISFNLNMIIGGYQSPVEFKIDMDFARIYQHKIFQGAIGLPIFSAEINNASQEMKQSGAIQITMIGEDPGLEKVMNTIENKLIDMCFTSFGSENAKWDELAKPNYASGKSMLESVSANTNSLFSYLDKSSGSNSTSSPSKNIPASTGTKSNSNQPIPKSTNVPQKGNTEKADSGKVAGDTTSVKKLSSDVGDKNKEPKTESSISSKEDNASPKNTEDKKTGAAPTTKDQSANKTNSDNSAAQTASNVSGIVKAGVETAAGFTPAGIALNLLKSVKITASYQTKSLRNEGKYTASAKHYFTTSLPEAFAGNIGKIDCKQCFREINLWDPLYVQREITAFVDGNARDFSDYINFVVLEMRKKHPKGDVTTDDIRIDRINFNKTGNNFKLMYGWMPGDNNRKTWLDYEYKTSWSFFGGGKSETDWIPYSAGAINLSPPMSRRIISIDADSLRLSKANVRLVEVKIYFNLGGEEQVRQVTLYPNKNLLSTSLEFAQLKNQLEYSYEINWVLNDNTTVETGRRVTKSNVIYADAIPVKTK
ncbi:hypothetical protein BH11BAC1_BH11BAC1_26350 [soil metagenome]